MMETSGDPFGSASGPVIPSGPHTAMTNVVMPKLWIGYLLAVATFIGEMIAVARNPDLVKKAEFTMVIPPLEIFLPAFVARAYWLVCVYRYHKILAEVPRYVHPISPAKAVGFHFIPFFNFFWIFAWPSAIADFVNARLRAPAMRRWVVGTGVLAAGLSQVFLDAAFGVALLFVSTGYLAGFLKRALAPGENKSAP